MIKVTTAKGSRSLLATLFATVILAFGLAFTAVQPAQASELTPGTLSAQDISKNYTIGKTVEGTVSADNDVYYAFTVSSSSGIDVNVAVTCPETEYYLYAYLENSSGNRVWGDRLDTNQKITGKKIYLAKGTYKMHLYTYYGINYQNWEYYKSKYRFKIATVKQKVKLGSKSGSPKIGDTKEISFTYNGSDDYAKKNISITKNSNKRVASAEIELGENGVGTLKVTPKRMGVTNIYLKVAGGNKAKYTATVKTADDYVAKGSSVTLTKPIGVSKLTYANKTKKSKKVATVTKKGVATGKKQGRAAIVAKKGKTTYSYNVVVTDYYKLAREAYELIDEYAPDPDLVKINYAYMGLCKKIYTGFKVPAVYLDISYKNEAGGSTRSKEVAWYDDALDLHTSGGDNVALTKNSLMGKKSMNKKRIKG